MAMRVLFDYWELSLVKCQRITIARLRIELACMTEQICELLDEVQFYRGLMEDFEGLQLVDLVTETQAQP